MVIHGWVAIVVLVVITLPLGLLFLLFPLKILRFIVLWPRRATLNLLTDEDYPATLREMKLVMERDPREFAQRFQHLVVATRAIGVVVMCILVAGLTLAVVEMVLPTTPAS